VIVLFVPDFQVFTSGHQLEARIHPAAAKPAETELRPCQSGQPSRGRPWSGWATHVEELHLQHDLFAAAVSSHVSRPKVKTAAAKMYSFILPPPPGKGGGGGVTAYGR